MIKPHLEILETKNLSPNPETEFEFDEEDLKGVSATWHTHPVTSSNLSLPDYYFFRAWGNLVHFIICSSEVACYTTVNKHLVIIDEAEDLPARLLEGPASGTD